ncbi:uncharacterized protein N7459_007892 [Penicillium hispanicum]|uniref:uncharacterized protein n=1 Tax=Penicillium hispanicum TaxID=1080232 RepID=UPI002540617F|nr:uncharacterized protein N7459_007892 [Penicillium hispanicum]KAJ5573465.1 hypothetical protein N7459_007892 [Penicillium hispanicum]
MALSNVAGGTFDDLSSLIDGVFCEATLRCALKDIRRTRKPCGNKIKRENLGALKVLFDDLFTLLNESTAYFQTTKVVHTLLGRIAENSFCHRHHDSNKNEARTQWDEELNDADQRRMLLLSMSQYLEKEVPAVSLPSPTSLFQSLQKVDCGEYEVAEKIRDILVADLSPTEQNDGYIYAIYHPEEQGMIKIGFSKKLPDRGRFAAHENCYPGFKCITTKLLRNARRYEKVILAEFGREHYQLKEPCSKCNHSHQEWLRVDLERLQQSLDKWIEFSEQEPYDEMGRLKDDLRLPSPSLARFRDPDDRLSADSYADSTPTKKRSSRRTSQGTKTPSRSPRHPRNATPRPIPQEDEASSEISVGSAYMEEGSRSWLSFLASRLEMMAFTEVTVRSTEVSFVHEDSC